MEGWSFVLNIGSLILDTQVEEGSFFMEGIRNYFKIPQPIIALFSII